MSKIYLIRHGQTSANNGKSFQGRIDNPLNEIGLEQVEAMAAYMEKFPVDVIYCSTMTRAKQTAEALARHKLDIPVIPLQELVEISFGKWEGLSFNYIAQQWPEDFNTFLTRPAEFVPPGGETFSACADRCQKAFDIIFEREGNDKNIAIVSHGGIIRVQLCLLLGIPLNNLWKVAVHNVSVTTLTNWQGNMIMETMNDQHFLTEKRIND